MESTPSVMDLEEGWVRVFDYQVLPLSLDQYWDAFYADNAPYSPQGLPPGSRKPEIEVEHIAVVNTGWREPEIIFEINGRKVLEEYYHEKLLRSKIPFTPKFCDSLSTTSLLIKNETHINIHFTGGTSDCVNSAEKLIVHTEWDILTPDPRSNQVIHRRMYRLEWTATPISWRIIDNQVKNAM